VNHRSKRFLVLLSLAATWMATGSLGCDSGSTPTATSSVPPPADSGSPTYLVKISSPVPAGASQLRIVGADEEGETVLSTTLKAEPTSSVALSHDVSTLQLDYLNAQGEVVATFVESAKNLQEGKFPAEIRNPRLVILPRAGLRPRTIAEGDNPLAQNPVIGSNVKFSFAFFGCNRARPPYDGRADFVNQLNQDEKDATANVAQLRQHFEDIKSLNPRPKFVFLCGDVVQKPRVNAVSDSVAVLNSELSHWKKIRASGPVIVDRDGVKKEVSPPGPGSVFPSDVTVVVMPGNHEMCYRTVDDSQELPNELSGAVFVQQMQPFIRGNNGPRPGVQYDTGGLSLPQGTLKRDESQLSYTFRAAADGTVTPDGEYLFMVLNTDTYTGEGVANVGRIPLQWIRTELARAQADNSVKHIFVFGHRPVETIRTEFGINPVNDEANNFDRLLNNPLARTNTELQTSNFSTKVRGYFAAHAHLMSTKQPRGGPVQQLVAGSGGSEPETIEGKYYPWFGFGVVGVGLQESVDCVFFGRNVHPSASTPAGHWDEQEPLKLRGPNISGPGAKPAKIPKAVRRLYPF
jgi:hypothetical protein